MACCGTHVRVFAYRNHINEDGEGGRQTHYFYCDQIGILREITDMDLEFDVKEYQELKNFYMNTMNTIFKLNEKLENLPSILSIEDELFFIDRLQTLPIDEIRENKEIFKRIISAIQESHQDNGIFEITDENIKIFFEFVIWIRNLKKLYHLDFEKYIDGFDTNFDGSQQI